MHANNAQEQPEDKDTKEKHNAIVGESTGQTEESRKTIKLIFTRRSPLTIPLGTHAYIVMSV